MESHPRKQIDARAKMDPHERGKQLIREWCDEQYERMMAEVPEGKSGSDPSDAARTAEKGTHKQNEGKTQES